ncbi:hypothetical protein M0813_12647 [Anaeramoeba flamelloides]|uniref:USP domain-containing protein n=1 Tax=Anaeramoeba flamelloides TaxID=1746091 RepID=A0ABQ8ZB14_9EUKA|nr:hypothetical protein M0813_12647 [Anaeramoeba flamelloides]
MIPKKNIIFEDIEKIQESEDTPSIHIFSNTNELNLRQSIVSQNQENYLKMGNVLEPFSNNNFIDSNKKNSKIKEKEKVIDNTINQITMSENIKNKNKKSIPNQIHSCFSEGDENKKVENTIFGYEDDYLKQFEDILIKPTILYEDDFKTMKITEIKRNLLGADIAYGKRDIPSIDDQEDEIKVISPKKQTKLIKKLNSLRSHDININLQLTNENIFLYLRKNKETKKLTDIQQSVNIIGINNFNNLCYFNAIIHSLLFVDIIEQTLENIHMDSSNALFYIIKKIKNSVGKNSARIRTTYNKIQSAYLLLLSKLGYNNNKMQSYKVGLNLIKKIFMYADNYFKDFTNDYYLKIKEQKFSYFTDKLLLRNVNIISEKFLVEKKFEKLFLHEDKKNKLFIQRISDSIIFFDFEDGLNVPYYNFLSLKLGNKTFQLKSFISYLENKHYISYQKIGNKWFEFDCSRVNRYKGIELKLKTLKSIKKKRLLTKRREVEKKKKEKKKKECRKKKKEIKKKVNVKTEKKERKRKKEKKVKKEKKEKKVKKVKKEKKVKKVKKEKKVKKVKKEKKKKKKGKEKEKKKKERKGKGKGREGKKDNKKKGKKGGGGEK